MFPIVPMSFKKGSLHEVNQAQQHFISVLQKSHVNNFPTKSHEVHQEEKNKFFVLFVPPWEPRGKFVAQQYFIHKIILSTLEKMKEKKLLFILLIYSGFLRAGNSSLPQSGSLAQQWLSQSAGFTENKGQIANNDGSIAKDVFFKTSSDGVDMYITEKGISYIFVKKNAKPELSAGQKKKYSVAGERETQSFSACRMNMILKNASVKKENIIAENPNSNHSNYFLPHCPDGIYDVKTYQKITIKNIYPGIDWVLYAPSQPSPKGKELVPFSPLLGRGGGGEAGIKYDFEVSPGADISKIKMEYEGAKSIVKNLDGSITVKNPIGEITEKAPVSFQNGKETRGERSRTIKTQFILDGNFLAFQLSNFSTNEPLTIDPPLVWATYYGGNDYDFLFGLDTDASGNLFLTGSTPSSNFNLLNPGGGAYYQSTNTSGYATATVLKFSSAGVLLWSTYYGGNGGDDTGYNIVIDPSGNALVTGRTKSTNFPVQNAGGTSYFQGSFGGGSLNSRDGFILKFNNAGVRQWATYLGGKEDDIGMDICSDASGNVFVTGVTTSTVFPTVNLAGAYNQSKNSGGFDIYICKFSNTGTMLWSTYYGGSADDWAAYNSICNDASGNIFVTGNTGSSDFPLQNLFGAYNQSVYGGGLYDAFILQFNNGGACSWATLYGGNGIDYGTSLCADATGNLFVTGSTNSNNFPLQTLAGAYNQGFNAGTYDVSILKFDAARACLWATYYGGFSDDNGSGICADASGNIYVTGNTNSSNFPLKNLSGSYNQSVSLAQDGFMIEVDNSGVQLWSTFYGGSSGDILWNNCIDVFGNLYAIGYTVSTNLPLQNLSGAYFKGAYAGGTGYDYCILKFGGTCNPPLPTITANGPLAFCQGNNVVMNAGSGYTSYNWSNGINTQTISINASGTYTVMVGNSCGSGTAAISVTVYPAPSVGVSPDATICSGAFVLLSASGGVTYLWSPLTGLSSVSGSVVTANPNTSSSYTLTATDAKGCTAKTSVLITVTTTATDAGQNVTILKGASVTLGARNGTAFLWSPSSGLSCNTCADPVASPTTTTIYYLTVTDVSGCTATDSVIVFVDETCAGLFFPDAFSPNGDGINDELCLYGTNCVESLSLFIYDRWGEKVFTSSDVNFCWDGTSTAFNRSQPLNTAVFIYRIDVVFKTKEQLKKTGNVSLIR